MTEEARSEFEGFWIQLCLFLYSLWP